MRRSNIFLVVALVFTTACQKSPSSPSSSGKPPLPIQPTNRREYSDFFLPINLSEDLVRFTMQFDEANFYPYPGSKITPLLQNTLTNPCPEYCMRFIGKIVTNPTSGGGLTIYFTRDGINRDGLVGTGYVASGQTIGTLAQSGNVPLWSIYQYFLVEWDYSTTKETKRGVKIVDTHFN